MPDLIWSDDFSFSHFGDGVSSRYTLPLQRRLFTDPYDHIDPFVLDHGLAYTGADDGIAAIWVDANAALPKAYASIEVGCSAKLTHDSGGEISGYQLTFGWYWPSGLPVSSLADWHAGGNFTAFASAHMENKGGYTYLSGGIAHQADPSGATLRPDWVYFENVDPLDASTDDSGHTSIDLSRLRSFRMTMTGGGLVVIEMGLAPIAGAPTESGPPTTQALTVQTTPDYVSTIGDMFSAGMIFPFCLVETAIGNTVTLTDWHYTYASCGKTSGGGGGGGGDVPLPIPSGAIDIPPLPLGGLIPRPAPLIMGGYPQLTPDVPTIQIPRS